MADITNFNIGQGETFKILVEIINEIKASPSSSVSVPQNIASASFEGSVKESYSSDETAADFSITKIAPFDSGSIFVELTPQQTLELDQRKYVYDILMTSGSVVRRILEGNLFVRPATTR